MGAAAGPPATTTITTAPLEDLAFKNAKKNSDPKNARIEHDAALQRVMVDIMKDNTQFFKHFRDNPDFNRFVSSSSFDVAYRGKA